MLTRTCRCRDVQVVAIALTRLLQTSLDGALDAGDPNAAGEAFCFRSCPCAVLPGRDPTKVLAKKEKKAKAEAGETRQQTPSTGLRHPSFSHCRI